MPVRQHRFNARLESRNGLGSLIAMSKCAATSMPRSARTSPTTRTRAIAVSIESAEISYEVNRRLLLACIRASSIVDNRRSFLAVEQIDPEAKEEINDRRPFTLVKARECFGIKRLGFGA